jgi:hypothetical protein
MTAVFGYVPLVERLQNRRTVPDPAGRTYGVNRRETVLAAARWVIWYASRWGEMDALIKRAPTLTLDMVVGLVQMQSRLAASLDALAAAMESHNVITIDSLSDSIGQRFPPLYDDEWIPAPIPLVRPTQMRAAATAIRSTVNRAIALHNLPTNYAEDIDYRLTTAQRMNGMGFLPALLAAHPVACIVCGGLVALSGVVGVAYVLTMTVDQLLNFFDRDKQSSEAAIDVIRETVQRQLRLCGQIENQTEQHECIQRVQTEAVEALATANQRINRGIDKYFGILAIAGVSVAGLYFMTRRTVAGEDSPRRRRRRYAA